MRSFTLLELLLRFALHSAGCAFVGLDARYDQLRYTSDGSAANVRGLDGALLLQRAFTRSVRPSDFGSLLLLEWPADSFTPPLTLFMATSSLSFLAFLATGRPFLIVILMLEAHRSAQGKGVPKLEKSRNQPCGVFDLAYSG